jgi:hypothetical protein
LGLNPNSFSKKNANSVVIFVPSATRFQSLKTIFLVFTFCHLRRFTFKKQGFPRKGKSRTVISSKKPFEINFSPEYPDQYQKLWS